MLDEYSKWSSDESKVAFWNSLIRYPDLVELDRVYADTYGDDWHGAHPLWTLSKLSEQIPLPADYLEATRAEWEPSQADSDADLAA
ncbi:hypothetical protein ACG83_09145 [Frankia sp. R43]|nr:hypothetical protein ACG83_09145 [Frankia sp. R43]